MNPPIVCGVASGKRIDLANPKLEDIEIKDIAWSLAHINRFNGHLRYPISVARHSIYVSELVPRHLRRAALLHDAHETYLGDIVRPVKRYFLSQGVNVDHLEDEWQRLIWQRFGCVPESVDECNAIIVADDVQLSREISSFAPEGPFRDSAQSIIGNMHFKQFLALTPQPPCPLVDFEAFMLRFGELFSVDLEVGSL